MRTLTIDERRAMRLAAVAAVTELAGEPLPEHARKRAAEGLRRQGAAVRRVMDEAREKGDAQTRRATPAR